MVEENTSLSEYVRSTTLQDNTSHVNVDWRRAESVVRPDSYTPVVEKPSVYSEENLRACSSLDAYNYVLNGYVLYKTWNTKI